jgi:hypothetical protein
LRQKRLLKKPKRAKEKEKARKEREREKREKEVNWMNSWTHMSP